MLGWLLSCFRKRAPDDDPKWLMETAAKVADAVMGIFSIQFELAQCPPSDIPQHKEFFVASYVAGFCDVMAQTNGTILRFLCARCAPVRSIQAPNAEDAVDAEVRSGKTAFHRQRVFCQHRGPIT